jgi:hypothetical protein
MMDIGLMKNWKVWSLKQILHLRKDIHMLLRNFWKIAMNYEIVSNFSDLSLNLNTGTISNGYTATDKETIYILDSITKKLIKKKDEWFVF